MEEKHLDHQKRHENQHVGAISAGPVMVAVTLAEKMRRNNNAWKEKEVERLASSTCGDMPRGGG